MLKKRLIFFIISFILISAITVFRIPIIGKFITGSARIIGKETKSEIYIGGKRKLKAKLFVSKSNFTGTEKRDYLILYLRDIKNLETPVLVIDKENKTVNVPNASRSDYNLVFGNLLQSDSGANVMVSVNNSIKGSGIEPKLRIEKNTIRFYVLDNEKLCEIIINIA